MPLPPAPSRRAPPAPAATTQATTAPPMSARASVGYRIDFVALDRDRDGRINRTEAGAPAALPADFPPPDTHSHGYLTPRELEGRLNTTAFRRRRPGPPGRRYFDPP